jgi:hypothetical protein
LEILGSSVEKSGIYSLGGFAFQIKVLVIYLSSLKEGMRAEFETYDDIAIRKLIPNTIDTNEDGFKQLLFSSTGIKVIQVKKTQINDEVKKKIIFNWFLIQEKIESIEKYILFTDAEHNKEDCLFDFNVEDLYTEVITAKDSNRSIIGKIKKKYKNDREGFVNKFNQIKSKYKFHSVENIDDVIEKKYELFFRKAGVNKITYYNRIKELIQHITYEIMESVNNKEPYKITYESFISCIEDISNRINDGYTLPLYSEFEKINKYNLRNSVITKKREYKQLKACNLLEEQIISQLNFCDYYKNVRFGYMELCKINKIKNIESTTFQNFDMVKSILLATGEDTPIKRLFETQKQSNSYAENEHIKWGSSIYLTSDEEKEYQISWEDEDE